MRMIWAEGLNGEIGYKGQLLWNVPEDLKFFKESTLGQTVVMGRKTWESLPLKPLPKRNNVVLSSSVDSESFSGATVVNDICEVVDSYPEAWIIGGRAVYEAFLDKVSIIHRTVIKDSYPHADTFAPSGWEDSFVLMFRYEGTSVNDSIEYCFEAWSRIEN